MCQGRFTVNKISLFSALLFPYIFYKAVHLLFLFTPTFKNNSVTLDFFLIKISSETLNACLLLLGENVGRYFPGERQLPSIRENAVNILCGNQLTLYAVDSSRVKIIDELTVQLDDE